LHGDFAAIVQDLNFPVPTTPGPRTRRRSRRLFIGKPGDCNLDNTPDGAKNGAVLVASCTDQQLYSVPVAALAIVLVVVAGIPWPSSGCSAAVRRSDQAADVGTDHHLKQRLYDFLLRVSYGGDMSVERDLSKLVATMRPKIRDGTYVFVTVPQDVADPVGLCSMMWFREDEGVTMIVPEQAASAAGLTGVFPCRMVTLTVHSALDAVGFLAAVTTRLAAAGISVNAVSAFFHDHLFVPEGQAEEAAEILRRMAADAKAAD
jgi:hypothetical protein